MGWNPFKSTYKYFAYAASSPLFLEDARPDTVKSLMLQATIAETMSQTNAVTLALQTNMYARARSMMRYALREDGYVRGLPETRPNHIYVSNADVKAAIERETHKKIVLRTVNWGEDAELYFIEKSIDASYLDNDYFPWPKGPPSGDYDYRNDEFEIPIEAPKTKGKDKGPKYLLADTEPSFTKVDYIYTVTFDYTDADNAAQVYTVADTYDLSQYQEGTWITVRYQLKNKPGETLYWTYLIGSGEDPILEAAITTSSLKMQYLPVAILMHDKVWYDDDDPAPDDDLEYTTHRLLKRLAMKPAEIKEEYLEQQAIDDAENDEEKSNAEEWDFFVHFAASIHSNVRGTQEYIFEYLRFLYRTGTWSSFQDYQDFLSNGGAQPSSNMHIEEGGTTGYHAWYKWSYITEVTHEGQYMLTDNIALKPRQMHSDIYEWTDANYADGLKQVHGDDVIIAEKDPLGSIFGDYEDQYHDYVVFTQQNVDADGNYSYTQVLMMAPTMYYVVNTDEAGTEPRERWVPCPLYPEDPEQESEFRFPINIDALKHVAAMHREELLGDSLVATVFLVDVIKVKWYQHGFMKWFITIAVVILVVLAWQYQWLPTLAAMAGAAAGATALGLWALYVVTVFAFGFMISFAGNLIGGKLGMLFVIAATAMLSGVNPFSNVGSTWQTMVTQGGWGSAISFINATTPFTQFGMLLYREHAMSELQDDMRDFMLDAREKQQILQDAKDMFGETPSWIDPNEIIEIQSMTRVESSNTFLERTLNPNPGVLSYVLISDWSEIALLLPQPGDETIVNGVMRSFAQQRRA